MALRIPASATIQPERKNTITPNMLDFLIKLNN